jgi:hypothetical protein
MECWMTWPDGPRASDRDRVDLFVPAYQYGGGYEYVNATVAMDLVASGNLASLHLYCSVAHVESDLQNADWGYGGRVTLLPLDANLHAVTGQVSP